MTFDGQEITLMCTIRWMLAEATLLPSLWGRQMWKPLIMATLCLAFSCNVSFVAAQEVEGSAEEKRERITAERFLQVLLRRPSKGTSLDRVFGYHIGRGDVGELIQGLSETAETTSDKDESGRHWMVVGLIQLQRSEDADAIAAFEKAEKQLPTSAFAAYYHGQALQLLGKSDLAAAAMKRAIDLKPPKQEFLKIAGQLGRLYQRSGKVDEAIQIWKQLEESFPGDDSVRQRIARVMLEEGDNQGALERYDLLAKEARSPNDKIVYALRAADLRAQMGSPKQAIREFEQLLSRLRPGSYLHDEARRRIEALFLASGDYAGLSDYYQQWIEKNPEDVGAVVRLARTLSIQGRGPEAVEWFSKAIERAPSDPSPRLALINALVAQEKFSEAAKAYESLVKLEPNNPDHLVRWGQILLEDDTQSKEERTQSALSVWNQLAESRPEDAVVQSQVADLFRNADLVDQALEQYRKAISLAPDQPQYKEYLGEYLHRIDRKDEAFTVWRTLAAGDLRTRKNLIRLAEVLQQFGRSDEAIKVMSEACDDDPTIEDRLRYAEWLREAEQFAEALKQITLAGESSENFDERERVFAAELKTYQASGELEVRIQAAIDEAEELKTNADAWRRLAVLYNAGGKVPEALDAIETSLQNNPNSIEALAIAARMYEESGRLLIAVEKRRQLADQDQRFRNGHLQKLSSLHLRIGNTEQAIAAGKELLAASAGSIDSYRYYADLCGKIGRVDQRLDTLRRCARLNPRNNEAQRMLASQLAEDFKTDQAIELYWKMLDGAADLDDRRVVVSTLADLYLRTNRLDQLISRLEIRGRESGDRRSTVDLIATAHQQAGDLGLAKQALEGLLRESGRDTLLLERLVLLAEQSGEYDQAVSLQRQLTRLAPDRRNESRLASLLIDIGEMDEAQSLWFRLSKSKKDAGDLSANINRLFAAGEITAAVELAQNILERRPDDWMTRFRLMVLQADQGEWELAAKVAGELIAMNEKDTTPPAGSQPYQRTTSNSGGVSFTRPSLRIGRIQDMYSFYRIVDDRYGYQSTTSLPKPIDFGHAKLMGLYCQLKQKLADAGSLEDYLSGLETTAMATDATADNVWQWYEGVVIASAVQQSSGINAVDPSNWKPLWRLVELGDPAGETLLASQFSSRLGYVGRDDVQLQSLPKERMAWLRERAASPKTGGQDMYGRNVSWPLFLGAELRIAGQKDEADNYVQEFLEGVIEDAEPAQLAIALNQAAAHSDDDKMWLFIERTLEKQQSAVQPYGGNRASQLISTFTAKQRIDKKLTKGPSDPVYRERVMKLVDHLIEIESAKPLRRQVIQLTGIGGARSLGRVVNGRYERTNVDFPPSGLGPENSYVFAQYSAWEMLKSHSGPWIKSLSATPDDEANVRLTIGRKLAASSLLFWEDRIEESYKVLEQATLLAAADIPQLEPELRLMSADLLLRLNRKRDALAAIDSLTVFDQRTMAVREFAAARLAAAIGDKDRAKDAARRLFGVRLNTDAQIELAKLMRKLEMRQLAADLVRRMRSRGGSSTTQLQSLMTYFVAQKENEQAAEVAMELLRRSAPSRRSSSRYTTANQTKRRNAMQTLATTGRLSVLITATEERLKNAPKSQRIRSELAEMYVAAGNAAKSLELLGKTDLKSVTSTRALETTAEQLVAAGKMDEACDAYLKFLRRKQDSFSQKFYDIKRPFDDRQRLGELADLMIEVGLHKFDDSRVAEVCEDLIRDDDNIEKARMLYSGMLDRPLSANNSMYSMSNVMGSARHLLTDRETVVRTAQYLIDASTKTKSPTRPWGTLFNGYSTSSDGRHNNVTTYFVRYVSSDADNAKAVEEMLRKEIAETDNWREGKVWLALLLTTQSEFDEAKELIGQLIASDASPAPSHDLLWLVGSLIDTYEPMHELSAQVYDYALENLTDNSNRDFKYSLKGRVCNFMADSGNFDRARTLALDAIEAEKKKPVSNSSNQAYEAYEKIRSTLSMMDFLSKIKYPSDALKIAREFDQSLFAKAGRYQRGRKEEFETKKNNLLAEIREIGGLAVVRSMVSDDTQGPTAIELGITFGNRPFTDQSVSSLWVEMLEQAGADPENADQFEAFHDELRTISDSRPDDDSVAAALAIADDISGEADSIDDLIGRWSGDSNAKDAGQTPALRERLLMILMLRFDRSVHPDRPDGKLISVDQLDSMKMVSKVNQTYLTAGLADQALKRNDVGRARKFWERAIELDASQWLLIDLSMAAIESEMPKISAAAFTTAVSSPDMVLTPNEPIGVSAGSLGDLLSSAQPRAQNSSSSSATELDPEEVRLARLILEVDEAWRVHKLYTKFVFDPLVALTLKSDGSGFRPLCLPVEIKPTDRIVVQSVFDRLARRASWAKMTDRLLEFIKGESQEAHMMSAVALLYADRGIEAAERLAQVDANQLNLLPKEFVIQTLLQGLKDENCRVRAMELSLALVASNRPTQRYANVAPFDMLSLETAKQALNNGMKQEFVSQSISDYLELCAHDNDRYSGSSSRITRRLSQLDKVAQLLLGKGEVSQALTYLGMRQSGFAQGFDRNNDWVGSWALESIQGMQDRNEAYRQLAEFTFRGDGPLQSLAMMVRRQRLPNWIPPSVGGHYPPFPPVSDQSLPIATNFYSLVRLAQQTDNIDDLTKRLETAVSSGRSGASTALVMLQAARKQPVDDNLIKSISQDLESSSPAEGKPKTPVPLAQFQLASILNGLPENTDSEFAKRVTEQMIEHSHSQSRGYLAPWVHRFQFQQGWAGNSKWRSADGLSHWIRSTQATAKDFSEGKVAPIWVTDGKSQVDHVCGFSNDFLWFRYPLEGNYAFEIESSDGGWSESDLVCDGIRFGALGNSGSVYLRSSGTVGYTRFTTKAAKKNEWNRCRVTLDDQFLSYHVNDILVYKEKRRRSMPWIGLHSSGNKKTSVRNIKVIGDPTIPRSVDLIPESDLRGWSGQYWGGKLPTSGINSLKREKDVRDPYRYRASPKPNQIKNLAWTIADGELISGNANQQSFNGQNSIRYDRPLGDGESIKYEFFHVSGKVEAHPTIGRVAYMLRPDGLKLHWMNAANTAWNIPKEYEVPLPGAEPKPIALNEDDWNTVELQRVGDVLRITVNGQVVFEQQPQSRLEDMVFGLFHNREKTSCRVRNVRLSGSWPEKVPDDLLAF